MKFAADAMLGRLAKWLRIVGYDTSFQGGIEDAELVRSARAEGRIILTRDAGLLKGLSQEEYLFIKDGDPFLQLRQTIAELGLAVREDALFSICTACNAAVEEAGREAVRGLVPEFVLAGNESFTRCPSCGKIYWRGTHGPRIMKKLEELGIEVEGGA